MHKHTRRRRKCLLCCFDLDYSERRSGFSREHSSDRDIRGWSR